MPVVAASPNIERKGDIAQSEEEFQEFTITARRTVDEEYQAGLINALGKYRSYSYIITLAALDRSQFSSPNSYREQSSLSNVILKSSGKAKDGESESFFFTDVSRAANLRSENTATVMIAEQVGAEVSYFNKNSPGRFDLYINNLRIDTVPTPTVHSGNTIVTNFSFDVYEPYSVAGFLEALRAAALTTGFINYLDATFIMKVEFIGYPDGDDILDAEIIPKTTRFFPIKFTKVDIDVNQSGSVYKCNAVSADSFAFVDTVGQFKFPLKMSGKTIKDLLNDMANKINENNLEERKKVDETVKAEDLDEYAVEFLTVENNKFVVKDNEISLSDFRGMSDSVEYAFEDINTTNRVTAYKQEGNATTSIPYEPDKFVVAFSQGTNIHAAISSIIRDSQYWIDQTDSEKRKENSEDPNHFGFWKIVSKVEYQEKYSLVLRRNVAKITYQIIKDKQHISRMQGFQADIYDSNDVNTIRTYNYLYSGRNTEITDLKIVFDKLFYERLPLSIGASNRDPSASSPMKGNSSNITLTSTSDPNAPANLPAGTATAAEMPMPTQGTGGNAGKPLESSAYAFARQNYENLTTSSEISMIRLTMEILGDPIYLVTGGLGNYLPEFENVDENATLLTGDGEANFLTQQPLVKIYFTHPEDIDPTDISDGGTGLLKFSNPNIKFSGIYGIRKVESRFNNGVFKQRLELFRYPFVVDPTDYKTPEVDTQNKYKTVANPEDQRSENVGENKNVPGNKRSSLKNLLNGVNQFADSLQAAEARIVGSIQGAVNEVTGAVSDVLSTPVKAINEATNKIQGALQEIDNVAVDAANKFGLSPNQLGSLSAKELLTVVALSKILPENVDISQLEENGVVVANQVALTKVPPPESIVVPDLTKDLEKFAEAQKEKFEKEYEQFLKQ
jgi:hypothetical protein